MSHSQTPRGGHGGETTCTCRKCALYGVCAVKIMEPAKTLSDYVQCIIVFVSSIFGCIVATTTGGKPQKYSGR